MFKKIDNNYGVHYNITAYRFMYTYKDAQKGNNCPGVIGGVLTGAIFLEGY